MICIIGCQAATLLEVYLINLHFSNWMKLLFENAGSYSCTYISLEINLVWIWKHNSIGWDVVKGD